MFADTAKLAKGGRFFDCESCKPEIQAKRRCREPRWDFTDEDDPSVFPLYMYPGGSLYGFCPSKVQRDDREVAALFTMLVIVAETGQLPVAGGLVDQPGWLMDELAWFLPKYSAHKFAQNIATIFPAGDDKPRPTPGEQPAGVLPARGRGRR